MPEQLPSDLEARVRELEHMGHGRKVAVNEAMIEVLSEQHDKVVRRLDRLTYGVLALLAKVVWDLVQSGALS